MSKFRRVWILIAAYFVSTHSINAEYIDPNSCYIPYENAEECYYNVPPTPCFKGHIFSIGPEVYHVKRTRSGGTQQNGTGVGVRATYDHIKRYRLYWGGVAFYGSDLLSGHSASHEHIRSRLTDTQIEGNVGYTLGTKNFPCFLFTPFVGYGYFRERNRFTHPSPLHVTLTTHFQYVSYGFLSSAMVNSWLKVGLNARFRSLLDTRCTVTHDPDFGRIKLLVGDRLHYRIELPFTYCGPLYYQGFELGLVPFYENRTYGGRENFPFDFFETKLRIYGVNFQLIYQF